jgi:hypothetical protein
MKNLAIAISVAVASSACLAQKSAFATLRFGDLVQVDLPRNWTYLDPNVAAHLNTSSEAVGKTIGIDSPQGNNAVLAAANAYDSAGKTKATLRVSYRAETGLSQAQMRELARLSPSEVEALLRPSADATIKAILQMPGVKSYRATELRIDTSGPLVCSLSRFEGDYGGRMMVSDTWLCPIATGNLKLTTSHEKVFATVYVPTFANVRRSLVSPIRP